MGVVSFKAVLVILFYMGAFACAGSLLPQKWHKNNLGVILLMGFLVYFSAFELIALPLKYKRMPLKYLSLGWMGILAVILLLAVTWRRRVWLEVCKNAVKDKYALVAAVLIVVTGLALGWYLGLNIDHISDFDANYYIGMPAGSVYTNTIDRVRADYGKLRKIPDRYYMLTTSTAHRAVIYQVLGLPPLVEAKFSFTVTMTMLLETLLYQIGMCLSKKNREKALFVSWFALLFIMCSWSISGVSHYFAYRTYDGKAVVAYFYTTMVLWLFLCLYQQEDRKMGWIGLFLVSISSVCFSNSAFMILTVMIAFLMPSLLWKDWETAKENRAGGSFLQVLVRDAVCALIAVAPMLMWIVLSKIIGG